MYEGYYFRLSTSGADNKYFIVIHSIYLPKTPKYGDQIPKLGALEKNWKATSPPKETYMGTKSHFRILKTLGKKGSEQGVGNTQFMFPVAACE